MWLDDDNLATITSLVLFTIRPLFVMYHYVSLPIRVQFYTAHGQAGGPVASLCILKIIGKEYTMSPLIQIFWHKHVRSSCVHLIPNKRIFPVQALLRRLLRVNRRQYTYIARYTIGACFSVINALTDNISYFLFMSRFIYLLTCTIQSSTRIFLIFKLTTDQNVHVNVHAYKGVIPLEMTDPPTFKYSWRGQSVDDLSSSRSNKTYLYIYVGEYTYIHTHAWRHTQIDVQRKHTHILMHTHLSRKLYRFYRISVKTFLYIKFLKIEKYLFKYFDDVLVLTYYTDYT